MSGKIPIESFIARALENPIALAELARVLLGKGERDRARELANKAVAAAPESAEIRALAAAVLSDGVPDWHFGIVRHAARNAAY